MLVGEVFHRHTGRVLEGLANRYRCSRVVGKYGARVGCHPQVEKRLCPVRVVVFEVHEVVLAIGIGQRPFVPFDSQPHRQGIFKRHVGFTCIPVIVGAVVEQVVKGHVYRCDRSLVDRNTDKC